ncbi:MAG: SMI1/KNR4 family protein [Candidatus Kaistia colombiensis]|nr:MAG: SMI1/KNR4 family protein [Kaistia sp.]
MTRHHPDRLPLFRPAADPASLARIETLFGKAMPCEIRTLYAAYDGQSVGAPSLYLNQRWLPLDLVRVAWEDLCQRYGPCGADAGGNWLVWSSEWLPLFGNPRGDHYCVDLGTTPAGRCGRILWFLYDEPRRAVIAASLRRWLQRIADGVEDGTWRLDDGY